MRELFLPSCGAVCGVARCVHSDDVLEATTLYISPPNVRTLVVYVDTRTQSHTTLYVIYGYVVDAS